ncbi:uncharacterized protein LOC142323073 isoform X2 [Lycorma delicatula]|uniref:uncharacterized protein LOC142323073 isoform X2 n=1 Tax=Lycorma delicatula TaxID=130591 RepID=UPI003F515B17
MPVINPKGADQTNSAQGQRTTFRPPWVKEGPSPLPMPSAPWTRAIAREAADDSPDAEQGSSTKNEPAVGAKQEKTIPIKIEKTVPITIESRSRSSESQSEKLRNERPISITTEVPIVTVAREKPNEPPSRKEVRMEQPPPPPPPMQPSTGRPPPPPPPPQPTIERKPMNADKASKLEALRSRPRRRPDWTDMMKEVEQGTKLKHVQCNDRSAPILPKSKAKGQFVYESEKDNAHNQLLKQIQNGVKLKKVRTNDRSRPILDGLRKFRRQMTIEEQIQKSTSVADVVALAAEPDELDDIDKVRDDLQCAKQMLALELRNKEGLERENKRLMARLLNLEAELEKEKASKKVETEKGTAVFQVRTEDDEKLIQKLKEEATEAANAAKEMEDKYQKIAEELDSTRAKLESAWLRNQQLDLQLKAAEKESAAVAGLPIIKQPSSKKLAASMASMPNGRPSLVPSDEESEYEEETETETEDDEESEKDVEAAQERRTARELKLLTTRVHSFKEKQKNALKERQKLRELIKKQQKALKEERKKYKLLQKEVDKMAKLMKDDDDELEEEEEEEKPNEDDESETESEDSDESEEEEEEEEDNEEVPENVCTEEKKRFLNAKAKRYENRLSSLKKGNYLMKANIDRLQDDLNRQKEMSLTLQEDLNSVLAELG